MVRKGKRQKNAKRMVRGTRGTPDTVPDLVMFTRAPPLVQQRPLGPEVKHDPFSFAATAVTSVGSVTRLTSIPQGSSEQQRIGGEVSVVGLDIGMKAYPAGTGGFLRYMVVQWYNDDTINVPTLPSFLANGGVAEANPVAPWNSVALKLKDFGVLLDETHFVTAAHYAHSHHRFDWGKKPLRLTFPSDVSQQGMGNLYLVLVSDGVVNMPTVTIDANTYYVDG